MTRLEQLLKTMNDHVEKQGEYFYDPLEDIKAYLEERGAYMALQLIESQSVVAKAYAKHFDNQEVV